MKSGIVGAALALSLLTAGVASAQPTEDPTLGPTLERAPAPAPAPAYAPAAEQPREAPAAPRLDLLRVNAGIRVGYMKGDAFDQFATSDALTQFSLDATYPLLQRGKLVLGAGLGYDIGGRSALLRGYDASMTAHRLSVPIEGRYHFKPWLYGFAKIAPGALAVHAKVDDGTTPNGIATTGWAFSADASAGASVLIGPREHLDRRNTVRFWATPEMGYGVTTRAPLALNAGRDSKDVLGSDEDSRLRSIALSGFFWRLTVSATF